MPLDRCVAAGAPFRLDLLPVSPPALHVVDAHGLRTTAVQRVPLIAFVQYPDGSQASHMAPLAIAAGGVWQYTHETSPFRVALAAGAAQIVFYANLTRWLLEEQALLTARGVPAPNATIDADCCSLSVGGGENASARYPSLPFVNVPPVEVSRLVARNTGHAGGYGRGDSIELTLRTRTDRAGFGVGEMLDREAVDALLSFSHDLGPSERAYAGVWRDACTLLIVVGNATGLPLVPPTAEFSARWRDDIYELKDARRHLQVGSAAS